MWFGERWITSVFDLFEENIEYFPALLPICEDEDPLLVLDGGGIPELAEMCLHNGTVYRWNRPVYGIAAGRPHLRVENRVLPAGPTVADIAANAAFYYGLVRVLAEASGRSGPRCRSPPPRRTCTRPRGAAWTPGLYWPGAGEVPAAELVLRRLLPLAREGLRRWGVGDEHADRLLAIIEQRCLTGQTGAAWQIGHGSRAQPSRRRPAPEALRLMTQRYIEHMHTNEPVHAWPLN